MRVSDLNSYVCSSDLAYLEQPNLAEWPDVNWTPDKAAKRVNLDTLTKEEVASWQPGDRILLNGKMLTGRDAAHKRIQDMLSRGEELRSEEHTSELQSLMRISYAVFCLKKNSNYITHSNHKYNIQTT